MKKVIIVLLLLVGTLLSVHFSVDMYNTKQAERQLEQEQLAQQREKEEQQERERIEEEQQALIKMIIPIRYALGLNPERETLETLDIPALETTFSNLESQIAEKEIEQNAINQAKQEASIEEFQDDKEELLSLKEEGNVVAIYDFESPRTIVNYNAFTTNGARYWEIEEWQKTGYVFYDFPVANRLLIWNSNTLEYFQPILDQIQETNGIVHAYSEQRHRASLMFPEYLDYDRKTLSEILYHPTNYELNPDYDPTDYYSGESNYIGPTMKWIGRYVETNGYRLYNNSVPAYSTNLVYAGWVSSNEVLFLGQEGRQYLYPLQPVNMDIQGYFSHYDSIMREDEDGNLVDQTVFTNSGEDAQYWDRDPPGYPGFADHVYPLSPGKFTNKYYPDTYGYYYTTMSGEGPLFLQMRMSVDEMMD